MPETINPAHHLPQVVRGVSPKPASSAQQACKSITTMAQATVPVPGPMSDVNGPRERRDAEAGRGENVGGETTPPSPPQTCAVVSPYLLTEEQLRELHIPEGLFSLYSNFYYQSCFGLRTWYKSLRHLTMDTEFLQLSDTEIDALYERCCASHAVQDSLLVDDGVTLGPELRTTWLGLKKRIDGALRKFPEGVFVRLDTRSTKDAPTNMINVTRVRKQILSAVEKMQHNSSSIVLDPKQALEAFMESSAMAMRATNVDEVLQLLRYSHQVREDLATLRRLRGLGIPCILALRKWDQELALHTEWEFRAFVHDNVITGISQLNHTVLNRELLRQRQTIFDSVMTFLNNTVLPTLPHKTFIVDLFFSPTTRKLHVVGLNPFGTTTCACLFDWRKDSALLLQGPCQFRIVEATPAMFDRKGRSEDVPMEVIPPKWARVLQSDMGCLRYDEHFVHPSLDASGRPMRTQSYLHMERQHSGVPAQGPDLLAPSASVMNVRSSGHTEAREVVHRATDKLNDRERRARGSGHATQSTSMPAIHHGHAHRGHRGLQGTRTEHTNEYHAQQRDNHKKGGCILM